MTQSTWPSATSWSTWIPQEPAPGSCLWTFNTVIPTLLQNKLRQLSVPDSTCRWTTDSPTDRRAHVRLGKHSITVWCAAATARDKGGLQRVILSAEKVIGCSLPSILVLHASRVLKCADKIVCSSLFLFFKLILSKYLLIFVFFLYVCTK